MNNNEILLLKLGEVVLKGLNRKAFEDKLMNNVRRRIRRFGDFRVLVRQSTIYVEPQNDQCDMESAFAACCQVFGVAAVARAVPCEKTVEAIVETAVAYLSDDFAAARSFKVESKRADKLFPMTSIQLSQAVGGELAERFPHVTVDVHNPDLTVYVEIREKYAYVHAPSVPGAGGLPVGMGGTAVSLLSGGLDSPVSSWMMARRGVQLEMVHFVSPPYTSQQALDKVLELARELTAYCGRMVVHVIPFTKIQEEIRKNCPEEYFTLIMRRFMMRISEAVAKRAGAGALVTGESLGQVASQTMLALGTTEDVTTLPVLRPLIGMDKVEIIRMARQIGTYDTSILPYEDCCTVFTPRHPCTRPKVEDVREAEAALDVDALVAEALAGDQWVRVKPTDEPRI
ncbi:tRNA uracil 4-sulfurtransferase ThiI [uncultured Oscillibacter sp.]|jgi:thiamine biosynthesis protein ThiI|uniref:tRNA uracil 4-sulfurtransferase ThiI n=1 Tax=Dysosmobacter sp. TaxID=2591382 RepID=UPI00280C0425|nr:tRNA uracil 4-sulfurtransferase ThiI [uncultured Oscillibacter sp.]